MSGVASVPTGIPRRMLERVVDVARRAPSIHNSQPWTWVVGDDLELWADQSRALEFSDPEGRGLVISCGAALQHALTAASAWGLDPTVTYLPDPARPDLLARISLTPSSPSVEALGRLDVIALRSTDRRRFTSWPIPGSTLARLVSAARPWRVAVVGVDRPEARLRIELRSEEARHALARDPAITAETRAWIGREGEDGVPASVPAPMAGFHGEYPHRFLPQSVDHADTRVHHTDTLLVISTAGDQRIDWLHSGAALSALWLEATAQGLSVVPLSQAVEYAPCRDALRTEVDLRHPCPQLLLRVGWQPIGRGTLARTSRRRLDDIVRPAGGDPTP